MYVLIAVCVLIALRVPGDSFVCMCMLIALRVLIAVCVCFHSYL